MKYKILIFIILFMSCDNRELNYSNQIHISYTSFLIENDKNEITISTEYIGGKIDLWTERQGHIKYNGKGIFNNDEIRGQGNSTVPIKPYKLKPGDKDKNVFVIDEWTKYKSYQITTSYYLNEKDCINKLNSKAVNSFILKIMPNKSMHRSRPQ